MRMVGGAQDELVPYAEATMLGVPGSMFLGWRIKPTFNERSLSALELVQGRDSRFHSRPSVFHFEVN
jgi:hypothetical protein